MSVEHHTRSKRVAAGIVKPSILRASGGRHVVGAESPVMGHGDDIVLMGQSLVETRMSTGTVHAVLTRKLLKQHLARNQFIQHAQVARCRIVEGILVGIVAHSADNKSCRIIAHARSRGGKRETAGLAGKHVIDRGLSGLRSLAKVVAHADRRQHLVGVVAEHSRETELAAGGHRGGTHRYEAHIRMAVAVAADEELDAERLLACCCKVSPRTVAVAVAAVGRSGAGGSRTDGSRHVVAHVEVACGISHRFTEVDVVPPLIEGLRLARIQVTAIKAGTQKHIDARDHIAVQADAHAHNGAPGIHGKVCGREEGSHFRIAAHGRLHISSVAIAQRDVVGCDWEGKTQ